MTNGKNRLPPKKWISCGPKCFTVVAQDMQRMIFYLIDNKEELKATKEEVMQNE